MKKDEIVEKLGDGADEGRGRVETNGWTRGTDGDGQGQVGGCG